MRVDLSREVILAALMGLALPACDVEKRSRADNGRPADESQSVAAMEVAPAAADASDDGGKKKKKKTKDGGCGPGACS